MPKRKADESNEERWRRKMKKYEDKLRRKKKRVIVYSSDEESLQDIPILPACDELTISEREPSPLLPISNITASKEAEPVAVDGASDNPGEIDPDLLQALGEFAPESSEWGQDINENLAKRWEPILKNGLSKEVKDEILKKYLPPKNCQMIKPPILNAELSAALTESARNRDQRIFKKQSQIGCSLSILGRLASGLLCKSLEATEALRLLSDATKLLADSHYIETETRRALVIPLLEKSFIDPFKDRKRDTHLFGDNLGEFIKSSRGIKKTGELIQAQTTPNLNWKGPPPRQQQRANRGGGPRVSQTASAATRRRAPATAPPAAPRRAPAPAPRQAPAPRRSYASAKPRR